MNVIIKCLFISEIVLNILSNFLNSNISIDTDSNICQTLMKSDDLKELFEKNFSV